MRVMSASYDKGLHNYLCVSRCEVLGSTLRIQKDFSYLEVTFEQKLEYWVGIRERDGRSMKNCEGDMFCWRQELGPVLHI